MHIIPKKKNLILFSSWFGDKYSDNSKYIFDYLLTNDNFSIFWFTRNKELYNEMKKNRLPVLYSKSLRAVWMQIRAKVLVATIGLWDFNQFFLSKCIYINSWHGIPLKVIEYDQYKYDKPNEQTLTDIKTIKYLNLLRVDIEEYILATSELVKSIYMKAFHLKNDNVPILGQPRNDVFYDEKLRSGVNDIVTYHKGNLKSIVYMPTHRDDGRTLMNMRELLDLYEINKICKEAGYVFILKKHYYHRNEKEDFSEFSNIFDVTNEQLDPQVLLFQADVLITDYSGCYYDYLLLNRPIIFYPYDIEKYLIKEREMYFSYTDRTVGDICENPIELSRSITKHIVDGIDDSINEREILRDKYYSPNVQREVRRSIVDFIYKKTGVKNEKI